MKPILFIADIHLDLASSNIEDSEKNSHFCDFLERAAHVASELYILGDLFEYWIGDDYTKPFTKPLDAIKHAVTSGLKIHISPGNRDFLLSPDFAEQTGTRLLDEITITDLNGARTLITHGDYFCTDDPAYMKLRKDFRNKEWQQQFLNMPLQQRITFAEHARSQSNSTTTINNTYDINQESLLQFAEKNRIDQIIYGHIHRPQIKTIESENLKIRSICLGDWHPYGKIISYSPQQTLTDKISFISSNDI
ncbi:MAG: UDP-2,3-diacylglucosamine diphosphatase [Gammaproteobacteria bacterium]|nr:MAG: UDP-2,3-diacylglucosamine diphosphatase [Gammaproteobacteria bacterium]